jgi:hypothetical protein
MRFPIANTIVIAELGALPCAYQVNNSVAKKRQNMTVKRFQKAVIEDLFLNNTDTQGRSARETISLTSQSTLLNFQ